MTTHPLVHVIYGNHLKYTVEKSQTNATNVTMHPLRQAIWEHIWQHTVEKSQTSAVNVNFDSVLQTLWRPLSKYTVEKKTNKCSQCDFASPHEGGNLWRYLKNELNGNTKYEYAKSYSNHDGIVEILSVEINSENRKIMEFGQEFWNSEIWSKSWKKSWVEV